MSGKRQPQKDRARATLDDLATRRGISSADLARRAGLSRSAVTHDRSGHRKISAERLAAYCQAFGPADQATLLRAWLADVLSPDLAALVEVASDPARGRDRAATVGRGVATAPPGLRAELDRLADACAADRDLLRSMKTVLKRFNV